MYPEATRGSWIYRHVTSCLMKVLGTELSSTIVLLKSIFKSNFKYHIHSSYSSP